jgi:hypothetical protein
MENKSINKLKPNQLARLLSISTEEMESVHIVCDDKATAELLRNKLKSTLPKDSFLLESLLIVMERLGFDMREQVGRPLCDVLLDPATDVSLLSAIKDYSKKYSSSLVSEAEMAVAITIYYAALASALLYHDEKITQYSYKTLGQYFALLVKKKWMTPELINLFSQAHSICQNKRDEK